MIVVDLDRILAKNLVSILHNETGEEMSDDNEISWISRKQV